MACRRLATLICVLIISSISFVAPALAVDLSVLECSASFKGIAHTLKLNVKQETVVQFSYKSEDPKGGDDCIVEGRNQNIFDDRSGSTDEQWDIWPNAILVQFLKVPRIVSFEKMRVLILKLAEGYQLSLSPKARANYCGLHSYIASTATLINKNEKCTLTNQEPASP